MTSYSPYLLDDAASIPGAFLSIANTLPSDQVYRVALREEREGKRTLEWRRRDFAEVKRRIAALQSYLQEIGVRAGDRIAIISNTRGEWMEADLAILSIGAISVSIYQSLTAHEVGYILFDSGARVVFAENEEQLKKLEVLANGPFNAAATEERPAQEVRLEPLTIIAFEHVQSTLTVMPLEKIIAQRNDVAFTVAPLTRDSIASLVYTSGTTGAPKGVIQTHGNHLTNVRQAFSAGMYREKGEIFLVLPLAHSFAKLMGYIGFLTRASLVFPTIASTRSSRPDPALISSDMRDAHAQVVPLVPRLFEKIESVVRAKAGGSGIAAFLIKATLVSAERRYACIKAGHTISPLLTLSYQLTAGIRRKIKQQIFGSSFEFCVSGGAKLGMSTAAFFDALDIEIVEGYGLTETCVATNVNRVGKKKIGSVGPVLDKDIELRIASDGEVLFRGPNIGKGYFGRPAATNAAWDSEGFFHTGDLGSLDVDGYLTITGRKKEIIVTSGGKKIPPDPIEAALKCSPYILQAVLCGDERPYCVVILVPNPEAVRMWALQTGVTLASSLSESKEVQQLLWAEVEKVNRTLASFETMKAMILADDDFTVENTLLTPSFKVKRHAVVKRYAVQLAAAYESASAQHKPN